MSSKVWRSFVCIAAVLLVLIAVAQLPHVSHFVEKILNHFLVWVSKDVGPWGPIVLALAYIPCTVLAIPASILTLGGGYLFGLMLGFVTDSLGSTLGATAAFMVGRTVGRSYVTSQLRDYPQFQAIAVAVRKSGFKIAFLLRLVPLLPFNVLNYLLSVTPISTTSYILASWFGMMPITLAFVYVGTTIKDIADITHGESHFTKTRVMMLVAGLVTTVVVGVLITRIAKDALRNAIDENGGDDESLISAVESLVTTDSLSDVRQPLIIRVDPSSNGIEGQASSVH